MISNFWFQCAFYGKLRYLYKYILRGKYFSYKIINIRFLPLFNVQTPTRNIECGNFKWIFVPKWTCYVEILESDCPIFVIGHIFRCCYDRDKVIVYQCVALVFNSFLYMGNCSKCLKCSETWNTKNEFTF